MKNYLIYGFASSGEWAFNLLIKKHCYNNIYIFDELEEIRNKAQKQTKNVPNVYVLNEINFDIAKNINKVILSPGVSIYDKWVKYFKKKKAEVVSELEFGFNFIHKKFIAITGTNGKTTTVKLLNTILNCAHKKSLAIGNIGYPICRAVLKNKKQKTYVCEVSSFQLEAIKNFKPHIACILNITDDHLNRHKTFLNYKKTKLKIAKNLNKKDYLIYNYNLNINNNSCNIFKFGRYNKSLGAFCKEETIYFRNFNTEERICNITDINLIGEHNLENVLAVITICKILKIKNKYILQGLKMFKPDPHRLEKVFTINNKIFIDDSKATNVDATVRAIECFNKNNLYVLLGGSNKGFTFDKIFKTIKNNVKGFVCFGEVRNIIQTCAKKYNVDVQTFPNLKQATIFCCKNAKEGDVVLLSPANASFDEFANYKERGKKYLEYIKNYFNINKFI